VLARPLVPIIGDTAVSRRAAVSICNLQLFRQRLNFVAAHFCGNVPLNFQLGCSRREEPLMAIAVLVILVIIVVVLVGMYNGLVQLRVRCDSAWSDIDVQLKRRHDLIPNLVETVKGYAAHEKGTFENIAKFRSQAMQATTPADKAAAENQLTGALKSLFAVAENYPELKASEEFTQLQGSLSQTEDSIQNARRYYNAVVRDLNTKIQSFPTNIIAGMFGFTARQFFETTEADREPVQVKF
jgi:LemA protein